MTVTLPRLSAIVQLVDPATGIATQQGAIFWNSFANDIEKNIQTILEQQEQLAQTEADLAAQIVRINQILAGSTDVPLVTGNNTWVGIQSFGQEPDSTLGYKVAGIHVVGPQGATIAALPGAATLPQAVTAINAILTALKTHGLIAP